MANDIDFLPNEYMVFEEDQVLTNYHLNQLFNYLDQQNRWTRNKLIGIGIVCGLDIEQDINPSPQFIKITKGCGITSQGYLVLLNESKYTYYISYTGIEQPGDFTFTYPGKLPFYKPFIDENNKSILQLLTENEFKALEPEAQKTAQSISSALLTKTFAEYAIVLFIEANELDLKNCDMLDCNNNGEKITLNLKTLLVKKNDLPVLQVSQTTGSLQPGNTPKTKAFPTTKSTNPFVKSAMPGKSFGTIGSTKSTKITGFESIGIGPLNSFTLRAPQINLKRFNVPYTDLKTTDDVINAFLKLVDDPTLSSVADAFNYCYNQYKDLLDDDATGFPTLFRDLVEKRDEIINTYPVFIQYFYDFIDDLVKAYCEFKVKVSQLLSACCPDENLFPLHLVLGAATATTKNFEKDAYRSYFIYSPLFARQENEVSESQFLFKRMKILTDEFITVPAGSLKTFSVRITPGLYQQAYLSQRAIPYYYNLIETNNELYKYWSYYKTIRGNAAFNLSYNSDQYNADSSVIDPLLYDIECYDFFRIEGHIGVDYQAALSNIIRQRKAYNLPFDIVAIAVDQLPVDSNSLPSCNIQDLDTAYKLLISEFTCKVHSPFCLVTSFAYPPAAGSKDDDILTRGLGEKTKKANIKTAGDVENPTGTSSPPTSKLPLFINPKLSIDPLAINIVTADTSGYQKGDFLKTYCSPGEKSIGSAYIEAIKTGVFINPEKPGSKGADLTYFFLFEYVDAVESLMEVIVPETLTTIDINAFDKAYKKYTDSLDSVTASVADVLNEEDEIEMDLIINEFAQGVYTCLDERLNTLLNEYVLRLQNYQAQLGFFNYYNNHYGLEHKAGVPKGGTFVLVYHPAQTDTGTDISKGTFTRNVTDLSTAPLIKSSLQRSSGATEAKLFLAKNIRITPEKKASKARKATEKPADKKKPATRKTASAISGETSIPVKGKDVLTNKDAPEITSGKDTILDTGAVKTVPVGDKVNIPPIDTGSVIIGNPKIPEIKPPVSVPPVSFPPVSVPPVSFPKGSIDLNTLLLLKDFTDTSADIADDTKKTINDLLTKAANESIAPPNQYAVGDNVVIADFYIPYLCCSDCAPVAYILQTEPAPPDETAKFEIAAKEYVFDDAHNYPFTAEPPVSNMADVLNPGNLNLLLEDGLLKLHPAMPDLAVTTTSTVTYKEIPVEIKIIKPDAAFAINELSGEQGIMLQLVATDVTADSYEWRVNEIVGFFESSKEPPPVSVGQIINETGASTFIISLTVSYTRNEVTSEATTERTYQLPDETATFEIEATEYVFDDAHNYPFTAEPPVTNILDVANPGTLNLLMEDDLLKLHPAMPDLSVTTTSTVTYKGIPIDIRIIRPDAAFTINELSDDGVIMLQLVPNDTAADSYEWRVNEIDGIFENSSEPAAVSLEELEAQTEASEFIISLTVSYTRNDVTSEATTEQTYQLPGETDRFEIAATEYVFNDENNYPFTAEPPVTNIEDVSNPGGLNLLIEDGLLTLHPAMPDLSITTTAIVTYNQIPINIQIIKPDAGFTINEISDEQEGIMLQLVPTDTAADSYQWRVDGGDGLFDNTGEPKPASLKKITDEIGKSTFIISLTVSYTRNGVTAEATTEQTYQSAVCIDFEKPSFEIGQVFGTKAREQPGDISFTTPENIVATVLELFISSDRLFGSPIITENPPGLTGVQCLAFDTVSMKFDYSNSSIQPSVVTLEFVSQDDNSFINFNTNDDTKFYQGPVKDIPPQIEGVKITIDKAANGNAMLVLTGPVKSFVIGGRQLFIDNVCAS